MPNEHIAKAPYNFVPFAEHPVFRYNSMDELPSHNAIDGSLLTGEIHIRVQAKTPIFVGKTSEGTEREHFFRDLAGRFAIPGSTLRGLIRENMQILGFGLIQPGVDLDDYQIYFREMASARDRVKAQVRGTYEAILDIRSKRTPTGKTVTIPQNVMAGYLCKEKGKYLIYPVSEPFRVSRNDPQVIPFSLSRGNPRSEPPHTVEVAYAARGTTVTKLVKRNPSDASQGSMEKGVLLFTGKPVGKIPNHIYVFPEPDKTSSKALPISGEDILAYELDLKARENGLKGSQRVKDTSFWELPKEGQQKPVFYVKYNGHIFFGMSRYPRVGYPYALSQGLPEAHRSAWESGAVPLDYPRAILGFADKDGSAYRSRVSFGDLIAMGSPTPLPPIQLDLLEPKPGYFPGYSTDGKPYSEEDFRLRGYKQYWLKEPSAPESGSTENKFSSKMCPLPVGTEFAGVIRYKNLHPDELGLLLLALVLDGEAYQSIGKGKPYGYGRTRLTVTALLEHDISQLYKDFGYAPIPLEGEGLKRAVTQYMERYMGRLKEKHHVDLRKSSTWTALMTMRQTICGESKLVSYMPLEAYKKIETPLPGVKKVHGAIQAAARNSPQNNQSGEIKPGMTVTGKVKSINAFGAYVDIGGNRVGMVFLSEISGKSIRNVEGHLAVGDIVRVKILSIDKSSGSISLSIKQAT